MGKTAEDLKSDIEQQRESLGRDLVAIGDRVSPQRMVERRTLAVRQSFGRARDAVMGAKDSAEGTLGDAGTSIGSAVSTVGDTVSAAPQAIGARTQSAPIPAGLIAFGIGALAGSLVPSTRREEQAVTRVQPALESAAEELGQGAHALVESATEQAADAAEHLKERAQDAADTVQSEAQTAVESVRTDTSRPA